MKKITSLLIPLLLMSVLSFSQTDPFFDVNEIKFKDFKIDNIVPIAMEFSDDEKFLFIISQNLDKLVLTKYDCQLNGEMIFSKPFSFSGFTSFKSSPDNKSILLQNNNGILYYWYDCQNRDKYIETGNIAVSAYSFANNNLIFSKSTIWHLFDIDKWAYDESAGFLGFNVLSLFAMRDEMLKSLTEKNTKYKLYFGNKNENNTTNYSDYAYKLWLKEIGNENMMKEILSFQDLGENRNYVRTVSGNSKRVAYFNGKNITVKNVFKTNVSHEYFCFDLDNSIQNYSSNSLEELKENFKMKLKRKDFIQARVCDSRVHPITGAPLGAGVPKAWIQIIKIEGNTFFGRFKESIRANTSITENDFIDLIFAPYDKGGHETNFKTNSKITKCVLPENSGTNNNQIEQNKSQASENTYSSKVNSAPTEIIYDSFKGYLNNDNENYFVRLKQVKLEGGLKNNSLLQNKILEVLPDIKRISQPQCAVNDTLNLNTSFAFSYRNFSSSTMPLFFADYVMEYTLVSSKTRSILFQNTYKGTNYKVLSYGFASEADAANNIINTQINQTLNQFFLGNYPIIADITDVTEMNRKKDEAKFVKINVGRNQGIFTGFEFIIPGINNDDKKGDISATEVFEDYSICKVLNSAKDILRVVVTEQKKLKVKTKYKAAFY